MEDKLIVDILEKLEPRIESKHKSMDAMLSFLQQQGKKYEDSIARNEQAAVENRKVFKEEILRVIEKSIQTYVNGKIDKLNGKADTADLQNKEILKKLESMDPMQKSYIKIVDFGQIGRSIMIAVILMGSFVGAIYVILQFFQKLARP